MYIYFGDILVAITYTFVISFYHHFIFPSVGDVFGYSYYRVCRRFVGLHYDSFAKYIYNG